MNYRLHVAARRRSLWLSGQYRLYDYDNRTPHFPVDQYVRLDGTRGDLASTGGSEPFGYTRHFVDVDASYTPWRFAALRVGYGQEHDDRTFRLFEETTDRTRARVGRQRRAVRGVRCGCSTTTRSAPAAASTSRCSSDIGEQVSLRQFDISDRTRDRVSAIVQVVPRRPAGAQRVGRRSGEERRPEDGLRAAGQRPARLHGRRRSGAGRRRSAASLTYGFERYTHAADVAAGQSWRAVQRSRPATGGPTWTRTCTRSALQFEIARLFDRAVADAGYDYVGSRAAVCLRSGANSSLPPPQQLDAGPQHVSHRDGRPALHALAARSALASATASTTTTWTTSRCRRAPSTARCCRRSST